MAVNPKERLKNIIETLNEDEAQELLNVIEPSSPEEVSYEEIEDLHEDVKNRFEDALRELAQ